ncbi:MAG: transglycosylase SLT domain-containing protein, partial [Desulfobacterales bacterium]|nr:transglycosylase SLT domain-containing protein [Desulfobacterales bacterium]
LEKELLLTIWDRPQVILWIKRSNRYMPYIEKMLKQNNMPVDLKYVPIIESALRPHAESTKGAMGHWQFIKSTGKRYGLTIDSHVDDRRNIFKSTEAAIRYFKALHEIVGSWTLAAAAYNMGENRLEKEIEIQETRNYYYLYIPLETQRYVFRILSAKMILSDPKKYGFDLKEDDLYPPLQFDRVDIECEHQVPIQIIARAANTYFKEIKDLNPEIRGHELPRGTHSLLIPKGASKGFKSRYDKLLESHRKSADKNIYLVKKGDTLSSIADKHNVPFSSLLKWNNLNTNSRIYPGEKLIIH